MSNIHQILGYKVFISSGKVLFTFVEETKSTEKVEAFGYGYPFITKTGFVQGAWGSASDFDFPKIQKYITERVPLRFGYDYRGNIVDLTPLEKGELNE